MTTPTRVDPGDNGSDGLAAQRLPVYECVDCDAVAVGGDAKECCDGEMRLVSRPEPAEPPELTDILSHVLGITDTELRVCILLMEDGPMTAGQVADELGYDSSYANRLLNHLEALNVVESESKLLTAGGRVTEYSHAPIEAVTESFRRELYTWLTEALRVLDEDVVAEKQAALATARSTADELAAERDDADDIYHDD
jgi:predicted transcriptional regulator